MPKLPKLPSIPGNEKDPRLSEEANELLTEGLEFIRSQDGGTVRRRRWTRIDAYLRGDHWQVSGSGHARSYRFDELSASAGTPLGPPRRPLQINYTMTFYRSNRAQLSAAASPLTVVPADSSDRAKRQADQGMKLWEYFRAVSFNKARSDVAGLAVRRGQGFIRVYYDPMAGRSIKLPRTVPDEDNPGKVVPELDEAGNPIYDAPVPEGEVRIEAVDPLAIYVDNPMAKSFDELLFFGHERFLDPYLVKEMLDLDEVPDGAAEVREDNSSIDGFRGINGREQTRIFEFWRRTRNEDGELGWRHMMLVNRTPVPVSGEEFIEFVPKLPYVRYSFTNDENGFFPSGPLDSIVDIQEIINRHANVVDDIMRKLVPRYLARRADIPKMTTQVGEVLFLGSDNDPDAIRPMQTPNVNYETFNYINNLVGYCRDIAGSSEISEGQRPKNTGSGIAFMQLMQASTAALDPVLQNFDRADEKVMELVLETARDNLTMERTFRIVGKDGEADAFVFKGADLGEGPITIRATAQRGLPRNPIDLLTLYRGLAAEGWLDPSDEETRKTLWDMVNFGDYNQMSESRRVATKKAYRLLDTIRELPDMVAGRLAPIADQVRVMFNQAESQGQDFDFRDAAALAVMDPESDQVFTMVAFDPQVFFERYLPAPWEDHGVTKSVLMNFLQSDDLEKLSTAKRSLFYTRFNLTADAMVAAAAPPEEAPAQPQPGQEQTQQPSPVLPGGF